MTRRPGYEKEEDMKVSEGIIVLYIRFVKAKNTSTLIHFHKSPFSVAPVT